MGGHLDGVSAEHSVKLSAIGVEVMPIDREDHSTEVPGGWLGDM